MEQKLFLSKTELTCLYEDHSLSGIAKIMGVSATTVRHWMIKYKIQRRSRSEGKTGFLHPMYDKHLSIEWKENIRKALEGSSKPSLKGKHMSPKTEFKKGGIPWNKGKKGLSSKNKRFPLSKTDLEELYLVQQLSTIKIAEKLDLNSNNIVCYWLKKYNIPPRTLSQARKTAIVTGRAEISPPTKPELCFIKICNDYLLPFEYVGDGTFWIGNPPLNPDFIHEKGLRIAVEIFGDYWHNPQKREVPYRQTEEGRRNHLTKYGWLLIVIWEHELHNEEQIVKNIKEFVQKYGS